MDWNIFERSQVYVTNAVKHFKWKPLGKRRLHQRPTTRVIQACHPWLEAEVELLMPAVIVCLGATAAQAVFGRKMAVFENRQKVLESPCSTHTVITVHPSAILRIENEAQRQEQFRLFVKELRFALALAAPGSRATS